MIIDEIVCFRGISVFCVKVHEQKCANSKEIIVFNGKIAIYVTFDAKDIKKCLLRKLESMWL